MATMEKSKSKKKKKSEIVREPSPIDESFKYIDIDFPSISIRDGIPNVECFVAANQPQTSDETASNYCADIAVEDENKCKQQECGSNENKDKQETDGNCSKEHTQLTTTKSSETEEQSPCQQIIKPFQTISIDEKELGIKENAECKPSAPVSDVVAITSTMAQKIIINYPNLESMKMLDTELPIYSPIQKTMNRTIIKPFTKQELLELYCNPHQSVAEVFENEFITAELNANFKNQLLYEMIMKYSKSRYNLRINMMDLQNLKKTFNDNVDFIWVIESRNHLYRGQCQDRIWINGTERFDFAMIDEKTFDKISSSLVDLMNLISFNYTLNAYTTNITKIQIEQYICEMLCCIPELREINSSTPIVLNAEIPQHLLKHIHLIRNAISILFHFLRSPLPDKIFANDLKMWLQKLVSVLLRIATWRDHLFLLFHILRCPGGIHDWATSMIQMPFVTSQAAVFGNQYLHHCMVFLQTLMLPIRERKEFLIKVQEDDRSTIDPLKEDVWIMVDSDGEDNLDNSDSGGQALKESDLIALLNQVPLKDIFSSMLFVTCDKDNNYFVDSNQITGHHLLKFIAFSNNFIGMLGNGLETYKTERYKQFAKILSRLIRHIVMYVTNVHVIFKQNNPVIEETLSNRIQIEYDTFVFRSSFYIYQSRNLGTWQYLAILPFADICIENVWKLYYCLSVGFSANAIEIVTEDFKIKTYESTFMERFNDTIIDLPAEDLYYLLQTFSSIVLSRESKDWDLIERITLDLFKIGFINLATKELCYKVVKDLLGTITTIYPILISSILPMLKEHFRLNDNGGIYLFKSLALDRWHPTINDFEIMASWLLNFGFETPESTLARIIFSRLNWNFDSKGELFLSHDIHIRVACLIVEVYSKHIAETLGSSGISESVRQVSMLVKAQTPKQQFSAWCWRLISILRLHCLDQNRSFVIQTLQDPNKSFTLIPELERINSIFNGVSESRPLALYASLLCSMWGHSVPQICHKGFEQLQLLLNDYRHSIVIRCLHLMVPLFLNCPESLSKCDKFQSILWQLLAADQTYLKMAKDLINADKPGPVVELLGNMILSHLIDYYGYGLTSPSMFIDLWLQCLTHNSNWTKDIHALYLIDLVLSVAYQIPETWVASKEYFRFLYTRIENTRSGRTSFLTTFLSNHKQGPFPVASRNILWLSVLVIELEFELMEVQTKFWPELLIQLHTAPIKFSLDAIIKKTGSLTNCVNFTSQTITIYKLVNLILTCSFDHPLLPIVCQKFFHLYLARVLLTADEQRMTDTYGVADKFYDANFSLMKRLKKFLIDAERWYKDTSLQEENEELSEFYNICSMLFKSFGLWLEETRLNKMDQVQHNIDFPPQYNITKLALIFIGDETPWNEYIRFDLIRKNHREASNVWLKDCLRYTPSDKNSNFQPKPIANDNPIGVITKHLKSYDNPIPAIEVIKQEPSIKKYSQIDLVKKVFPLLKKKFKTMDDAARQFDMNINELKCLDCNYKELVRLLYRNEEISCSRSVKCSSLLNNCRGSNMVQFKVTHPIINDTVGNKIANNRDRHEKLINKLTATPLQMTVNAIVEIQHYVRQILFKYQEQKSCGNKLAAKDLSDVGIEYFYTIINGLNEYLNGFPPANELCAQTLTALGILIQENQSTEGINLLQTVIRRPNLVKLISDLFVPSITGPPYFIAMYKFIVDSHMNRCDPKILFVLLSKFDMANWLIDFKPKLSELSQLVKLIVQGLACWNQNDAILIQGVLRRHLVHIFEFDFPEHYGEILQIVNDGCSDQSLMPCVLMDLVNSIYKLANCPNQSDQTMLTKNKDDILYFATNQKLFTFKDIQDTMALLARHYQNERLQHGLHGLYPKHKLYCDTILLLFKSFGYGIVVAAVHAYPGTLADSLVEWIWPIICDMFSPWLVPYYPQSTHQVSANWIKQVMSNSQILLPWSELHADNAQKMLHGFMECIQFMLDTLPTNTTILSNIFYWYELNFGNLSVPRYVLAPIHSSLTLLPWIRFRPTPIHLDCIHRILEKFIPECHNFVGFVFLRINWTLWLQNNLPTWDFITRQKVLSWLLSIFVKLAFEPHVRENVHFIGLINETVSYPWHLLEYQGIEKVFDWFCTSTEPSIVLQLQSEHGAVDCAVLNLLQVASAIRITADSNISQSQTQSKRILYIRTIVRMLRLCGSKHAQLLSTKEGLSSFNTTVMDLINVIENISVTNDERVESETTNLLIEVVCTLQSQGESISKLLVDALILWQSKCTTDSVILRCLLSAIGTCKIISRSLLMLIETTIYYYFKNADQTKETTRTWKDILYRLNRILSKLTIKDFLCDNFILGLHVHILNRLNELQTGADRIAFLDQVLRQLSEYKTIENTEAKFAIIWCLIILCSNKYRNDYAGAQNLLATLTLYLQMLSTTTDNSWSEGLLEAIGIKKDGITKKRRIITRCFCCVLFSMHADKSQYNKALDELMITVNSKKFADIRSTALLAIDLVDRPHTIDNPLQIQEQLCRILRLFYLDPFINTLEDVWTF